MIVWIIGAVNVLCKENAVRLVYAYGKEDIEEAAHQNCKLSPPRHRQKSALSVFWRFLSFHGLGSVMDLIDASTIVL